MNYIIKNHKNVFIRLNENGKAVTCSEKEKMLFEYSKGKNILEGLPRTLKKLNFKLEALPDIIPKSHKKEENNKQKVIRKENYILSDNIKRWIEKFGICEDILNEAKDRKKELFVALSETDRELSNELHSIELNKPKNACGGFLEYKRLKEILDKRRDIKDEMKVICHVIKMDFRCLNSDNINEIVCKLASRKFTYRVVEEEVKQDANM